MPQTSRTFAAIPPETAEVLRPVLSGLADETIAAIAVEVPDYARAMEGEFGKAVRRGVEIAFQRFLELVLEPRGGRAQRPRGLRRTSAAASTTRAAASTRCWPPTASARGWRGGGSWRPGREAGLAPEVLYDLGEAIFAYIDEISAESADGYAQEQSAAAGEAQRRRRRLVRALAEDPPASEEAIRTVAAAAGWALPRRVAALVVARRRAARRRTSSTPRRPRSPGGSGRAPSGAAVDGTALCVFVPDPGAPGRRRALEAALAGARGGARAGRAVAARGGEPAPRRLGARARPTTGSSSPRSTSPRCCWPPTRRSAPSWRPPGSLRSRALASGQRERLEPTLRAWLDRPGQVQAVAAALGVHPQTVRYRMTRLRELFGERLEDPDARFELSLALRVAPMR